MIYTSLNNEKIKKIRKLKEKKYRDQTNLFLIEGEHLIKEAYSSNVLEEVFLLENTTIDIDIPISYVTKEIMKSLNRCRKPK